MLTKFTLQVPETIGGTGPRPAKSCRAAEIHSHSLSMSLRGTARIHPRRNRRGCYRHPRIRGYIQRRTLTNTNDKQCPEYMDESLQPAFDHNQEYTKKQAQLESVAMNIVLIRKLNMRIVWLAPSSMWSFTTRLAILISETLHYKYPESAPTLVEKEVYPLRWECCATKEQPDISGLPSLDYALYLFDTVKFHLGQSYRFFDEEQFIQNLNEFYHGDPISMASEQRLWFIQYLLVLSFGSAFLSRTKSDDPPGSQFFVRAMSLMPNHTSLWKDSLLAIEVLAMVGLYLYSIDQRESAYIYVSTKNLHD